MAEPLHKTHETESHRFWLTDYVFGVERISDGVKIEIPKSDMGEALCGLGITQIAVVEYRKDEPVKQSATEAIS